MKKIFSLGFVLLFSFTGCETAKTIGDSIGTTGNRLTSTEVIDGLKTALQLGTDSATIKLSKLNGFYGDAMVKILMPSEAADVEKTLRNVGLGGVIDKAVLSMNRAAEDASKYAGNIFIAAIKQMTIQDAFSILRGGDTAATNYLRVKTAGELTLAFKPVISKSLENTHTTKYWSDVFNTYNRFSNKPVTTDLTAYVTQKTLDGLFYKIGQEEQQIRREPAARVKDILKKVFGNQNTTSSF